MEPQDHELRAGLKLLEGQPRTGIRFSGTSQLVKAYSDRHFGLIYLPNSNDPDYMRIDAKPVFRKEAGHVRACVRRSRRQAVQARQYLRGGNSRSQDRLVLREFHDMAPGDVFNASEMEDAGDRLRKLPYFQTVSLTPIGDDPDVRDVLVEVQEQHTASFNVGAGINSNGGVGWQHHLRAAQLRHHEPPRPPVRTSSPAMRFVGRGEDFRASSNQARSRPTRASASASPTCLTCRIGASERSIFARCSASTT